jgi:hypothetical protein
MKESDFRRQMGRMRARIKGEVITRIDKVRKQFGISRIAVWSPD